MKHILILVFLLASYFMGATLIAQVSSDATIFSGDNLPNASVDAVKFGRAGIASWKRKDYQTAINNFYAALTYPMSPELNQQIRDIISFVEEEYRKTLTYQRNRARRMELSNELALKAMSAWELRKGNPSQRFLAVQLAHWACKVSNNQNVLALRLRSGYLNESGFIPSPPQEESRYEFITTETNSSSKARVIIWKSSENEVPDTIDLDVPPIIAHSGPAPSVKKFIALTEDKKAYWVNYESGEIQPIVQSENDTITSVALWETGDYYALGYNSGDVEIFDKNYDSIFKHRTSGKVKSLGLVNINSNKKGRTIDMISLSQPNALFWKIKLKNDKAPDIDIQRFADNATLANLSQDKKKIVLLTNENGLQFFSGSGKKDGEVKYPFTSRDDNFVVKDLIIRPNNETVIVKYLQKNLLENTEIEHTEEIAKNGKVLSGREKVSKELGSVKSSPGKLPNLVLNNTFAKLGAKQIRFINNGKQFAALSSNGDAVRFANAKPYQIISKFSCLASEHFTEVAADPLGKYIVATTDTNVVYVFNTSNSNKIRLTNFKKKVKSLTFSAQGNYFACSDEASVILYNATDGSEKSRFKFTVSVTALSASPSGDTIMVGLADGNVVYVHKNEPDKIIASGLGRQVGPISKVSFSRRGKKSLILSKDKSRNKMVLDIVNNDLIDTSPDRRYLYESPDEIDINYAEFSADDNNVLLTRKNETILLSAEFLKPDYAIQKLKSPHINDEIKEAYLIEGDQFIATLSFGGDLWIQTNGIDYLDRKMEDLSLLEQIKYKVAEPDSLRKYAISIEELDKSIEYLSSYALEDESDHDTLRNIIQILLERRIKMPKNEAKDSTFIYNCYYSLAHIFEERSLEQYERVEPSEALELEKTALVYLKKAWLDFSQRPDIEKKQAEAAMCRIYNNMSWLNICEGQYSSAQAFADTSDIYISSLPACVNINLSNRAIIHLQSGQAQKARDIFYQYQNVKCSDQKGNETMKEVFKSDLSYLLLLDKIRNRKSAPKLNSKNTISNALKWLN